ncbi:MFS transporter [Metarhizium brunneum]
MSREPKYSLRVGQNSDRGVDSVRAEETSPGEAPSFAEIDGTTNRRLLRTIDWKLMPVQHLQLCAAYALQYYDKAILGQAVIFGLWYTHSAQVLRSSYWYSFSGGSLLVSPLINYSLGHISGGPVHPWQYMYLIADAITFLWGIGFTEEERKLLEERVRANNAGAENNYFKPYQLREALTDHHLWGIITLPMVSFTGSGVVTAFGSIIFNGMGIDVFTSPLVNLPIGALAFICILGSGYLGRTVPNSRFFIIAASCFFVIIGCGLL